MVKYKYVCIEDGIYFVKGNIYFLYAAPNMYNDNWVAVSNLDGQELTLIYKTSVDFYFINLAQFRENRINDITNDYD